MARTLLVVLIVLAGAWPASAQVLAPPLPRGVVDLGYTFKQFHRDMEPGPVDDHRWDVGALYVRYGAIDWLTLSFEGAFSNLDNEDSPGTLYRRYTVGVGATARVYRWRSMSVEAGFHYVEVFDNDLTPQQLHKRARGVLAGVFVSYPWTILEQVVQPWGGIVYSDDATDVLVPLVADPICRESVDNLGIAIGADLQFFEHVSVLLQGVYVNYWQGRFGIALRVGGDE